MTARELLVWVKGYLDCVGEAGLSPQQVEQLRTQVNATVVEEVRHRLVEEMPYYRPEVGRPSPYTLTTEEKAVWTMDYVPPPPSFSWLSENKEVDTLPE